MVGLMTMSNRFAFTDFDVPDRPISPEKDEVLEVEYDGALLKIGKVGMGGWSQDRIYARRTLSLGDSQTFMMLPGLPDGIDDDRFFPALGTVVFYDQQRPRRLRAAGT